MIFRKLFAAAALFLLAAPGAYAEIRTVTVDGVTGSGAGGPYTISGGFKFDCISACGDLSSIFTNNSGIFDFNITFSNGTLVETFTNNLADAGVPGKGSFDLSTLGTFTSGENSYVTNPIVTNDWCLSGVGGIGTCDVNNPGGIAYFSTSGGVSFSPSTIDDASTGTGTVTWTVASVPEVTAKGSIAAFGTLLALMAFLWERRSRKPEQTVRAV